MDDYPSVRKFILDEFRLTPIQFKERFEKAIKLQDETYTLFCSRLRNLMIYYHRSRSVYRYEELLSLLIADKIKSTLTGPCLDFILTAEKDEWMPCEKLSTLLDTYYASRPKAVGPSNVPNTGANQRYFKQPNVTETVLPNAATETAVKVTGNAGNQSTQSTYGVRDHREHVGLAEAYFMFRKIVRRKHNPNPEFNNLPSVPSKRLLLDRRLAM